MAYIFSKKFATSVIHDHGFNTNLIPDLTGKVAIVTGANVGLGYETALALGLKGAHVFLACRNKEKADAAIKTITETIKETNPNVIPMLEFLELDLNDIKKADASAKEFVKKGLPLHILVNNSGIMNTPFGLTADGIEQQFGVNHIGHFVFTLGVLDIIKQSQPSRIVNLSSNGHHLFRIKGGVDFDTLNQPLNYSNMQRYGRSKLCNVLFTKALARRLSDQQVFVNCCHPGGVNTELMRHTEASVGSWASSLQNVLAPFVLKTPADGALTQLFLAASTEVEEKNLRGLYFIPTANEMDPNPDALDEDLQERLWDYSVKVMNEKLNA